MASPVVSWHNKGIKENPLPMREGVMGWVKPRYFFVQWAMFQTSESQEVRLTPVSPFV